MTQYEEGDRGEAVSDIQRRLNLLGYLPRGEGVDGVFGKATNDAVRGFQKDHGLPQTGVIEERAWTQLVELTYELGDRLLYLRSPFFHGKDVEELQHWLNRLGFSTDKIDGVFGPRTEQAVRDFQKSTGEVSDGIVGPSTLRAFECLQQVLRENGVAVPRVPGRQASVTSVLRGRRLAVDASTVSDDLGARVVVDLASRLGNLLELLGAEVVYARSSGPALDRRMKEVNKSHSRVFVCFSLGTSDDVSDQGTKCLYFAHGNEYSVPGKQLALSVQRELVRSLARPDLGVKGGDVPELQRTAMPAVIVQPAYLSSPEDILLLREEVFRQKAAVAVFDGLKNFLLKQEP